jgi:general secretion pathway protein E
VGRIVTATDPGLSSDGSGTPNAVPLVLNGRDPPRDGHAPGFAQSFGAYLIEQKAIEPAAIERAFRAAQTTGERFDHVLTKLGLVSELDVAVALSKYLSIPLVTPAQMPTEPILPGVIDESFVRRNRVLPLAVSDDRLVVGVVDPFNDEPLRARPI